GRPTVQGTVRVKGGPARNTGSLGDQWTFGKRKAHREEALPHELPTCHPETAKAPTVALRFRESARGAFRSQPSAERACRLLAVGGLLLSVGGHEGLLLVLGRGQVAAELHAVLALALGRGAQVRGVAEHGV